MDSGALALFLESLDVRNTDASRSISALNCCYDRMVLVDEREHHVVLTKAPGVFVSDFFRRFDPDIDIAIRCDRSLNRMYQSMKRCTWSRLGHTGPRIAILAYVQYTGRRMKIAATIIIAVTLPTIALAEQPKPMPMPKIGAACPTGYQSSAGYCLPGPVTRCRAMLKVGACPVGYTTSFDYCVETGCQSR